MKHNGYLRISLAAQAVLAVYFQAVNWFNLGSWNDQPGFVPLLSAGRIPWGRVVSIAVFLFPVLLFWLAYWKRWGWLMWIGTVGYGIWLYFQIRTWWVPYIFGASRQWEDIYKRVFARTTKILPSSGNHLAPDALHLTIQLLLLVIVTSTLAGLVRARRDKGPSLKS